MGTYILYHDNCQDGFGSAYAAWKKYGDSAIYIPCAYGKPLPKDIPNGSTVFMIDYSGSREEMIDWNNKYSFQVIDHHKTAEQNLKGLSFAHFDMTKSGALLAWEFFNPRSPVPFLLSHISDRDLWQFKLPDTKAISIALFSYPYDFNVWDKLSTYDLANEGKTLLRYQDQIVDMICKKAYYTTLNDHKIVAVNATSHWSEVGSTLAQWPDAKFAVSYYKDKDGYKWSLRSVGDFDVSAIAKQFGGGGHLNASGFTSKTLEEVGEF